MSLCSTDENPTRATLLTVRARLVLRAIGAWASTCTDYHRAANHYESLWKTVGAELARLGISRRTLAQTLCEMHDRAWQPPAEQTPQPSLSEHPSADLTPGDSPAGMRPEDRTGPGTL
jgi:hypothetical protein